MYFLLFLYIKHLFLVLNGLKRFKQIYTDKMQVSSSDMEDIIQVMNKNLQICFDSTPNFGIMKENPLMNNSTQKNSFFCVTGTMKFKINY